MWFDPQPTTGRGEESLQNTELACTCSFPFVEEFPEYQDWKICFGRSIGARLEGRTSIGRLTHWVLRVTVTGFGVAWNGLDRLAVVALCLAALLAGLGYYAQQRPARGDDPETRIFPEP